MSRLRSRMGLFLAVVVAVALSSVGVLAWAATGSSASVAAPTLSGRCHITNTAPYNDAVQYDAHTPHRVSELNSHVNAPVEIECVTPLKLWADAQIKNNGHKLAEDKVQHSGTRISLRPAGRYVGAHEPDKLCVETLVGYETPAGRTGNDYLKTGV